MANRVDVSKYVAQRRAAIRTKKILEKNLMLEILDDYCSSSTLHGISYFNAKDKNLVEKIWWMIMFVLSVASCSYLISQTWIKWKNNPVILSFNKEKIPIWEIPFPAVTICPVNKIEQSFYNYTENFLNRDNLNESDAKIFWDLSLVCNLEQYYLQYNSTIDFTDESAISMIRSAAPNLYYTIHHVQWQHYRETFDHYFTEQLTEEGVCYSFNSFSQEDMFTDQINENIVYIDYNEMNEGWNIEDGYPATTNMTTYPVRTAKDGRMSGLTVNLLSNVSETNYVCGLPISGFKVILHNPAETPKVSEQYFLVPLNKKVSITVRPEVTKTEKDVRDLPPHTRKCYFSNEKSLRFFKVYTQNNCRKECTSNITEEYCDCVPFYMPSDNKSSICSFGKDQCIKIVQAAILTFEVKEELTFNLDYETTKSLESTREIFNQCDCLPSCSDLQYTAETSQTDFHFLKAFFITGVWNYSPEIVAEYEAGKIAISQLDIFFKESQFLALVRSEIYGQTDFLANCGGLLGLFMGFSLLSLWEIIYFLTIRLWFKYRIRRKHKIVR